MLVGVAAVWNDRKGLDDYIKLASILPDQYLIILFGLTLEQQNNLPKNIFGIQRTHNQYELAQLYSMADILLSLSYGETFGMTIAEAYACGTPCIVYDNTAQPEIVSHKTGRIVKTGNNILLLTDGDRYATDAEKLTQIHKHFTGTEANFNDRCNNILAYIKQFCPDRAGVSPETYIWETLKSSEIENEITEAAHSISYVDDTHRYVGDIIDKLGFSKEVGQTKVCEQFRCETNRWDNYIVQLADWLNSRIAVGVI